MVAGTGAIRPRGLAAIGPEPVRRRPPPPRLNGTNFGVVATGTGAIRPRGLAPRGPDPVRRRPPPRLYKNELIGLAGATGCCTIRPRGLAASGPDPVRRRPCMRLLLVKCAYGSSGSAGSATAATGIIWPRGMAVDDGSDPVLLLRACMRPWGLTAYGPPAPPGALVDLGLLDVTLQNSRSLS